MSRHGRCPGCGALLAGDWCGLCHHRDDSPTPGAGEPLARLIEPVVATRWRATTMTFGVPVKVAITLVVLLLGTIMWTVASLFPGIVYVGGTAYLALAAPFLGHLWRRSRVGRP